MENINEYFESEFQEKLSKQLFEHRKKRNLKQRDVADAVRTSCSTYQRWESTGRHLTDIATLLRVFQVLDFSTTEIIDVLGLPPLTLSEVESIYQDEDLMKSVSDSGILSAMREKCPDINVFILERLLILLMKEHSKRLENRHGNP